MKIQKQDNIWYHGSRYLFNTFDKNKIGITSDYGTLGVGIYLTDNKDLAKHYATQSGYVYTCKINVKNPLVIDSIEKERDLSRATYNGIEELANKLGLSLSEDSTYNDPRIKKKIYNNYKEYLSKYDSVIGKWKNIPQIILDNNEICVFNPDDIEIIDIEKANGDR